MLVDVLITPVSVPAATAVGLLVVGTALAAPPDSSCLRAATVWLAWADFTAVLAANLRQAAILLCNFLLYPVCVCSHAEIKNIVCLCTTLLLRLWIPPLTS